MTSVKPLLFSGPMVRALMDGKKTQTRRIIKPQPTIDHGWEDEPGWAFFWNGAPDGLLPEELISLCPHGQNGGHIWVRETWAIASKAMDVSKVYYQAHETASHTEFHEYVSTQEITKYPATWPKWKPSIHMPRCISRITLNITGVRVERLQEISPEDADAEGVECWTSGDTYEGDRVDRYKDYMCKGIHADHDGTPIIYNNHFADDPVASYKSLWQSLNGPQSWDENPWVWVIDFGVIKENIDKLLLR